MDIQKEREAFECEFKQTDYYIAHGDLSTLMLCDDQYALNDVQVSFEMWQAAKAQAVPRWISVKNAMPKAGSQVLTYDDYGFVSVENIDGCEDPNNVYFSHWLPLPPVEQEPAND